jgi:phosphoglycerate dehydrogenase-like enzyme
MSSKPVVILDPNFRTLHEIFEPEDLVRLNRVAEVVWGKDEPCPDDVLNAAKSEASAIICARWRYGSVDAFPKLRAILDVGGRHPSPNLLDYKACFARSIRVLTCAPAFGPMVAEMALGMALACTREIVDGHVGFLTGEEKYFHPGNVGTFTLFDQPVGFIGFGGLARNLKPLLDPFRCRILAYDPWLPATYLAGQGVTPATLEEVLSKTRVIFVLAIPSAENRALLDRAKLELIQRGATLVLISRAHLVDFDALTDLLLQRRFKAAIDVFPVEPLPKDHPIRHAPGVVLSGHRAGSVEKDLRLIGHMAVDDIETMAAGLPPLAMQVAQPETVFRLEETKTGTVYG